MSDTAVQIASLPVGVLIYLSGLLIWPVRRWVRRNKVRGKALGFVFLAQLASYAVVFFCSTSIRLEHFYYWFIFLIELNVVFTIAALIAWARDVHYERAHEAGQVA